MQFQFKCRTRPNKYECQIINHEDQEEGRRSLWLEVAVHTSGSRSSTLLQLTSLDGNVTYVTYRMLSLRMQMFSLWRNLYIVATVAENLIRTPVYFFPTLVSVFGNEKQTSFVSSYFWRNAVLTAFQGWFIHVEGMREAHPGKFLISWINWFVSIVLSHCTGPVRVSEARYSFENNSITYLLISQPVTYLWMRPDSSRLAKALPEALLLHSHPSHSPWGKQKVKYLQRVNHTIDGSPSAFLALWLYKDFLKRPILTKAFHRDAQGQFWAIIITFVQKCIL